MPLAFRRATAADIPLLRDLAHRIWHACYPGIITVEQIDYMLGWMYSPEKIADELATGVHWELTTFNGADAGFLALTCPDAAPAELHKLYLLPELHGHGHGQAMLRRAFDIAASHGCPELHLRVNKGNTRALRSYERAGFSIIDSLVADIGGGFVMDDFILARTIDRA